MDHSGFESLSSWSFIHALTNKFEDDLMFLVRVGLYVWEEKIILNNQVRKLLSIA